jgi:xanthine dehydrogenase large subunit
VLIDRFTGEMRLTRADVLIDAGVSINPGIDRGQITGGFIQGVGWVTTEELVYRADTGELLSHSPTTYKIPNVGDVPRVFNIDLLENPHNTVSLRHSKAVGEPPLLLGISAWAAVKNALSYVTPSAELGSGGEEIPDLKIPATGEQILMLLTKYERAARGAAQPAAPVPATASPRAPGPG